MTPAMFNILIRAFNPMELRPKAWLSDTGTSSGLWPDVSGNGNNGSAGSASIVISTNKKQFRRFSGSSTTPYSIPNIKTIPGRAFVAIVSQRSSSQLGGDNWQRLFSCWDGVTADDNIAPSIAITAQLDGSGVSVAYTASVTTYSTSAGVLQNIKIGANSKLSSQNLIGDVSEVLIFDRFLSNSEISAVKRFFARKYAI